MRLQVPVRDLVDMDRGQPLCERGEKSQGTVRRERAARAHGAAQRGPRHVLGGQPVRGRVERRLDQLGGVGAAYGLHGRGLPPEPGQCLGVIVDLVADNLHGHQPSAGRPAEIYLPHAARAEPGENPVRAYLRGVLRSQLFHRHDCAISARLSDRRTATDAQPPLVRGDLFAGRVLLVLSAAAGPVNWLVACSMRTSSMLMPARSTSANSIASSLGWSPIATVTTSKRSGWVPCLWETRARPDRPLCSAGDRRDDGPI